MLENNSKVAASHPDLGYSIWLEFVCLAPSISVYLKFGSLNQASRETPFSSDKGPVRGKGSFKGGRAGISYPAWQGAMQ